MNQTFKKILNTGERAFSTFVEQFFTVLLGSGAASLLVTPHLAAIADRAGFAALMSLGMSILTFGWTKQSDGVDNILRIVKTGAQVTLGDMMASGTTSLVHTDWNHALAAGLTVMGPAALKVLAAQGMAATAGGSLIPKSFDHSSQQSVPTVLNTADLDYSSAVSINPAELEYDDIPAESEIVVPPHQEANLVGAGHPVSYDGQTHNEPLIGPQSPGVGQHSAE